ncbi:MAG: glycosyltransferase [Aureliella sp.]
MRIKVCQIIPTLVQGGAEKQMTLLSKHLDRERFDVEVIVLTHTGPYEKDIQDAGIKLHFINKRWKFDPFAYRRLSKTIAQIAPDVVHTWLFAGNSYGRVAAKRNRVPVVVAGERSVDPWKASWQFAVDRKLLGSTDCIATNTSAVTHFYGQKGLNTDKFRVIPNAVESPQMPGLSREEVYQRLKIPPRGRLVGAVGRLWAQKGYRDLIWAGELLHVAYQDVWFVIIGEGPDLSQLQHFRDLSGAKDSVKFAGHRTDATDLMSGLDVLWNGSLYEGQSNTILEAMARGVPVVASDIPGNRDLMEHDRSGILYPLGDVETLTKATNVLLRSDDLRASMGAAAAQRVKQVFSLEQMVRSYDQLYTELHAKKG